MILGWKAAPKEKSESPWGLHMGISPKIELMISSRRLEVSLLV
jgi:hypothetical protein